ncbi:MAG TPA: hypothetical protein H9744_10740 [Candidatus Eisenbergiella stercoravium]|nr:hypothetical protein [Candidatus Eisenbergiella stercoravium]
MGHYENFRAAIYCTAQTLSAIDGRRLEREWEFLEKYVGVDKVYLETFRNGTLVPEGQIRMIRDFFQSHGVETAGGITAVTPDLSEEDGKRQRLFSTFCYSNKGMRDKLKEVAEYTAGLFNSFILDDFFFTSCTCEDCIRERGNRSWSEFRAEKMREVSENLVIGPAKRINPEVKITIKYPNWRESWHETGYIPEIQRKLFDFIYTGTETRNTAHTDQHLPRYLSYSLMRYMENVAPGRNGGGWFDTYSCWPMDCYLEQAYLTAFSRPEEITLFQWGDLFENRLVTPLSVQLSKIDRILNEAGNPVGTPVYLPFGSCGENHLEDHLGMQGAALEPVPDFPWEAPVIFLTAAAFADREIMEKLERYLMQGGTAVVTSGFVREAPEEKWKRLSSIRLTGRKLSAERFQITDDPAGYYEGKEPVQFDELQFCNNASWSFLNAGTGDSHSSILLMDTFGRGKLFTLAVPDVFADLSRIPVPAMDMVRRVLTSGRIYISGRNVSIFTYDNGVFVLYCYAGGDSVPEDITVHLLENAEGRADGQAYELEALKDGRRISLTKRICRHEGWTDLEMTAQIRVLPGEFAAFRVIR